MKLRQSQKILDMCSLPLGLINRVTSPFRFREHDSCSTALSMGPALHGSSVSDEDDDGDLRT